MSLSRWLWLARLKARLLSPNKRPRRRPIHTLSGLRDWELEDRCLLSGGVPVPTGSNTAMNQIMFVGGAGGIVNPTSPYKSFTGIPTQKTLTFTNNSAQTIYPFLRDANTGAGPGGKAYDPQDQHDQEYREYVGYVEGGKDYLGLPSGATITILVPLVFWNANNTYIATNGTALVDATGANPFQYDTSSTRGTSSITPVSPPGPLPPPVPPGTMSPWVTQFTSTNSDYTGGFVMLYHATLSHTPGLSAPAQLAEFTIRDPYLKNFGLTDTDSTTTAIDYDVSYVDNAIAPIAVEASAVPVTINPDLYNNQATNPPAPPYGWTGSTLNLAVMQTDIGGFVNNTGAGAVGSYFTNPTSPPPAGSPPPSGWPSYYVPGTSGGGVVGTSGGGDLKIPAGQNIFLQSPLNGTPNDLNNVYYMLSSGGTAPYVAATGGNVLGSARQTVIPLTLNVDTQDSQIAALQGMLKDTNNHLNMALSTNPGNTLGTVTNYIRSGPIGYFKIILGGNYTQNPTYKITGGGVAGTGTGTAYVNSKGAITRVGLPHYNSPGVPIYTSMPAITLSTTNGSGGQIEPYIEGESNGVAPGATSKGMGYTAGTYTYTIKGTTAGGVKNTATGTVKFGGTKGSMQSWSFPKYTSGTPIYTSTPSVTIAGLSGGTGAQLFADIGGGAAIVTLNSGASLPLPPTTPGWVFTRPATDYATTDITNLWYTWAQYYINYFKSIGFTGEQAQGTLTVTGNSTLKNQAALLTLDSAPTTPLAVGMTVSGNGIPTNAGPVTIVNVQDSTHVYLSQLPLSSGPFTDNYKFAPPPAVPFSDSTGIENITVTNGGTGYVPPLTVSLTGGNGAGATAEVTSIDANGAITGIKVDNAGGNYSSAPTVNITGGGGSGAIATATINAAGQVTGITIQAGQGGSNYTMGTTVTITGGGGSGATAVAVVNPDTNVITGIRVLTPGSNYSSTASQPLQVNIAGKGSGASATATIGTSVTTYQQLLPAYTDKALYQGGTALQFAGSVYEAMEAEASISPAVSLSFYNAQMPGAAALVGTTIGSNLGALPNANGGASNLAGQVRDLIKSVLRGVWNFELVPNTNDAVWYPAPGSKPISTLPFNPFNLDPYVWFIHTVLNMSGYGFSTDDDVANVGAGTSPHASPSSPAAALPNNFVIAVGGITPITLPNNQQWFPGVPWGTIKSSGKVSVTTGGKASVTLATSGTPNTPTITKYFQVLPVTPGQIGAAYVIAPGVPAGTTVNNQNTPTNLSFFLNVPSGQKVTPTPSGGGDVTITFQGTPGTPTPVAPVITGHPNSQSVAAGSNVSFSASASGTPLPTVQWQQSTDSGVTFTDISGATSTTLALNNVTTAMNGYEFQAVFSNSAGQATTDAATLTVTAAPPPSPVAPVITGHPNSQSVVTGSNVLFSASASGTPLPTVQWQQSTDSGVTFTDISGATSTTLALNNVTTAMNGYEYQAVFSNTAGNATTNVATLTVTPAPPPSPVAPVITQNPSSQSVVAGSNVSFLASASGTPSPTVQWQQSTDSGVTFTDISGATSTTLALNSVTTGMSGYEFQAVFNNSAGQATTNAATLTVTAAPPAPVAPVITQNPSSQSVVAGSNVSFLASASGTPLPTVQWQQSTNSGITFTDISGATSTTLALTNVTTAMSGYEYQAVFSNSAGQATTNAATLTVTAAPPPSPVAPVITEDPNSQSVTAGSNVLFSASASGTPSPTVQWQYSTNGVTFTDISGATSTTLALNNVTTAMSGYEYQAVFSNTAGNATTNAATLTVTTPPPPSPVAPVITEGPNSQSVAAGSNVLFSASASGTPSPTVQWQDSTDGGMTFTSISGATSTTLALNNVTTGMSGYEYQAVFSNSAGQATTNAATLTVTPPSPPPPPPPPTPTPTPTPSPTPTPAPTPAPTTNELFDLVRLEIFRTINQTAAFVAETLGINQPSARLAAILAYTDAINANPLASTPFGQLLLTITRIETLKFLQEVPIPFAPDTVL